MFFPYACIIDLLTTQKYVISIILTNNPPLFFFKSKRNVHFSIKNSTKCAIIQEKDIYLQGQSYQITNNKIGKMGKFTRKSVIALTVGAVTLSSCIGSFGLTNSVLKWNRGLSQHKFLNELVFIVISPAYAICATADLFVLNTIEFWTGNKVVAHVGETKDVMGKDGRMYAVKTLKNGYEITSPDGEVSYLVYNKKEKSWNYKDNGALKELFRFNDDGTIQATLPNGKKMNVTPDQAGLYQVRMAVNDGVFFASRK